MEVFSVIQLSDKPKRSEVVPPKCRNINWNNVSCAITLLMTLHFL